MFCLFCQFCDFVFGVVWRGVCGHFLILLFQSSNFAGSLAITSFRPVSLFWFYIAAGFWLSFELSFELRVELGGGGGEVELGLI